MHLTLRLAALAMLVLAATAPARADDHGAGVRVEQPWARATVSAAMPAAAYLTIVNDGAAPVRLVGASSPMAGTATIHQSRMTNGVMTMRPVGHIEVAPGGRARLAPGGYHIMLMGLAAPLRAGARLALTLRFDDGRSLDVAVPVLGIGAMGPGAPAMPGHGPMGK